MNHHFAVIETGGRQYVATPGSTVKMEKIGSAERDQVGNVSFNKILLKNDEGGLSIGVPYIEGFAINGLIVGDARSRKVTVVKYKSKVRYHKKNSHRQPYTLVKISEF